MVGEKTYWWAWLCSSNDFPLLTDADSEIALSELSTPQPSEPGWTKVQMTAMDEQDVPAREPEERNGTVVHCRTRLRNYKMDCLALDFPDEREQLRDITALFGKQWVFLSIDGYESGVPVTDKKYPDRGIHTEGNALVLGVLDYPAEHKHDTGRKGLTVGLQKVYPIYPQV